MPVASATILRDTIFYIKDWLDGEVTDPISSTRSAVEKFIMTSYPARAVTYPIITIKDVNSEGVTQLGFQSEAMQHYVTMEVRVWARNVKERDDLADSVYSKLKDNQIGATGTSQAADLHDFRLLSSINIDDPNGPKSKVMTFRFLFVAV